MRITEDIDVADIVRAGTFVLPDGLDAAERARLDAFLEADLAVDAYLCRGERPPEAMLETVARAAVDVYDRRTERLGLGGRSSSCSKVGRRRSTSSRTTS